MYFLVLQEEMTADAETFATSSANLGANQNSVSQTNPSNFFPPLLPEEEIQKVIFDANYLEYIYKKQQQQGGGGEASVPSSENAMQLGSANMTTAGQGSPTAGS